MPIVETGQILATAGVASGGYIAQQLFGKTLAEMGDDLNKLYKANRDKLVEKAASKVVDPHDGAVPNLRVARDVLWNGGVTDDEVCAEYFGGILAASRSADGKDDSALIYVDCIKALSSKQLHLHFAIYNALNELLKLSGKAINPAMQSELTQTSVWFATNQLNEVIRSNVSIDLSVLHRQGLISAYASNIHVIADRGLLYVNATPTIFGVLLYAAALNKLNDWKSFGQAGFVDTSGIPMPGMAADTLADLCQACNFQEDPPRPIEPPE